MKALALIALLASCNGFDPLAQPPELPQPFANAGVGSSYPPGSVVTLDGSSSFDASGQAMTYHWTVVQSPSGSTAAPTDPSAVTTTFVVDEPGTYRLNLEVTDTALLTDNSELRIVATGAITDVDAGVDQALHWLDTAQLAGTITTMPGWTAAYTWTFISRPAGSNAMLQSTGSLHPTFVADVVGTYVVALNAAIGDEVAEATMRVEVTSPSVDVGETPVAYAYAKQIDRVVYADGYLPGLVEFDPTTSTSTELPLGTVTPRSIAIDPSGNYIGVGGPDRVVTYKVAPFAGYQIQNVPNCNAKQISIPDASRIDCFPMDGTIEPISSVNMTSGEITTVACPVKSPVVALATDGSLFMADEASPQLYEYDEFVSVPVLMIMHQGSLTGLTPPLTMLGTFPPRAVTGNGWIVDASATLIADLHTPVSVAATSSVNNELATASGDHVEVFATDAAFTPKLSGTIPPIHGMTPAAKFLAYSSDEHRLFVIATSAAGDVIYTVAR